jgi:hypothetical protein
MVFNMNNAPTEEAEPDTDPMAEETVVVYAPQPLSTKETRGNLSRKVRSQIEGKQSLCEKAITAICNQCIGS